MRTTLGGAWAATCFAFVVSGLGCGGDDAPPTGDGGTPFVCASDTDCDDGLFCNGVETCAPGEGADGRGCVAGTPPCLESQRCLADEGRCVTSCAVEPDADGDGVDAAECGGADCDDTDPDRFPGNVEICDSVGHDEDCDPATFGDRDADGDGFVDALCCNDFEGTMRCGDDCNDRRRDAHPGVPEVCEGLDNDCDGSIDEGLLRMQWPDADRDLHGDEASEGVMVCPGEPGYSPVRDDCDDTAPTRHRAQLEICDGLDNDCDGVSDEAPVSVPWYPDEDDDGFGAAGGTVVISCAPVPGYSTRSSDCNDADRMVNPAAAERCNGIDDDCDGFADAPGTGPGDTEDDDGDGVADVVCGGSDCDDANPFVGPRAQELCNGIDDNCDGVVDGADANALWYLDRDRDGYGDEGSPPIESCEPQPARVPRGGDCNDEDASVRPGVRDVCDDVDQDCDGRIDEGGIRFAFFPDADGDGWGVADPGAVIFRCTAPAGTSERSGDCADTDAMRYPSAPERCNSVDNDCDGTSDEAVTEVWYLDVDGDGRGAGSPVTTCLPEGLLSSFGDDCDDGDATRFPGNTESCDGRDDDCDPNVDEGAASACGALVNASASTCAAGGCNVVCDGTWGDCDGDPDNGCETFVARNPVHCGTCGNACGAGDTCGLDVAGVCDRSPVVQLATGQSANNSTVMALRETGGVAAWGSAYMQRGTFFSLRTAPTTTTLAGLVEVEIGQEVGCGRLASGRLLCWGENDAAQLGRGVIATGTYAPGPVVEIDDARTLDVGLAHGCAVRATGEVWCWGYRTYGQTGYGTFSNSSPAWAQPTPLPVPGIDDAVDVHCTHRATCVLRGPAGARYVSCFGDNGNGIVGDGTTTGVGGADTRVDGVPPDAIAFASSSAQLSNACVLTSVGSVHCWGENPNSSLGLGSAAGSIVRSATQIAGMPPVVEVALGNTSGCARTASGEVYCWGHQITGLSWIDGVTTGTRFTPMRAGTTARPIDDAVAITVGTYRWCAVRASGGVVCMGSDETGALGDGDPQANVLEPTDVLGLD
ncbi:MAG: hypothetical protein H6721_28240 [Sandaracinus sp.]|nr:hypothetical protein [Sandaracinus sp.]MCB9624134.1 hypothetical protein [Sandaracinus sp.]MCB9636019.1 hypothetical protein [Sandaracinus sp.]